MSKPVQLKNSRDIIGFVDQVGGKSLKVVAVRPWRSRDGYDFREYIDCEVDGKLKKGLMYFFSHGQVDMLHLSIDTIYGRIVYHERLEDALLA